jgi:hypothetical protein
VPVSAAANPRDPLFDLSQGQNLDVLSVRRRGRDPVGLALAVLADIYDYRDILTVPGDDLRPFALLRSV